MLAVMLSEKETRALLRNGLALAAVNGAKTCVVSGASDAIRTLHDQLKQQDVYSQLLHTSHAFHSEMMEPILEAFSESCKKSKTQRTGDSFSVQRYGRMDNACAGNGSRRTGPATCARRCASLMDSVNY